MTMMKQLRLLLSAMLLVFAGSANAAADETIFLWQSDGNAPTLDTSISATGGTATFSGSAAPSTESASYNNSVTDDLKSTGTKALKLGTNTLYMFIELTSGYFQAGDVIYISGYNPFRVGTGVTSNRADTDLSESLKTGTGKADYNVGSVVIPSTIGNEVNKIYISRANGSGTGLAAVKIVRPSADAPQLNVTPANISLKATEDAPSASESISITGSNLPAGEAIAIACADANLSLSPSSLIVADDGSIEGEVVVTFAPTTNMDETTATISFTIGSLSKTVNATYSALLTSYTQEDVTESTIWDFSKLSGSVQTSSDDRNKEFLYANTVGITFPDADFDPLKLTYMGEYPIRDSKYAQNVELKFNTTVAGKVTVSFSNTGSSNSGRVVKVNDQVGTVEAVGTTTQTEEFEVEAGEVVIKGVSMSDATQGAALRFMKVVFEVIETGKTSIVAAYEPGEVTLTMGDAFEAPVLRITEQESGVAVEGLAVAYESDNTAVATVDAATGEISIVGAGEANITANVEGGDVYTDASATMKITVISASAILHVTETTEVGLTKENINANDYLSVTTDNWQTGKTYGDYTGDFYNMSKGERQLSIIVEGAQFFEIYVQNGTAGRTYTYQFDSQSAQTITHPGGGVVSSGLIACSDELTTITFAGTDASVYPVYVKFYTALPTVDITLNQYGYATMYYSDKAFVVPAGVTATTYDASVKESVVYEEGSIIPAGEAVVLNGAPNAELTFVASLDGGEPDANSALKGLDSEGKTEGDGLFYMLSAKNGQVGFYWGKADGAAFTSAAHKAYLVIPATAGAKEGYAFAETTGISQLEKCEKDADSTVYNLNGQRVEKSYRGVVIVNGKKMMNK